MRIASEVGSSSPGITPWPAPEALFIRGRLALGHGDPDTALAISTGFIEAFRDAVGAVILRSAPTAGPAQSAGRRPATRNRSARSTKWLSRASSLSPLCTLARLLSRIRAANSSAMAPSPPSWSFTAITQNHRSHHDHTRPAMVAQGSGPKTRTGSASALTRPVTAGRGWRRGRTRLPPDR